MHSKLPLALAALLGISSCTTVKNTAGKVSSGARKLGNSAVNLVRSDDNYQYNTARFVFSVDGSRKVVDIALDPNAAPNHVANFKKLVNEGFYNGLAIHRAIPNYLVQTGDPRSQRPDARPVWGLGGPGYTIRSEIGLKHTTGSVAMARLGEKVNPLRESNGSQFYVALKPLPELNGQYTVFGTVVQGLDVLRAISNVTTDENDVPISTITIASTQLVPGHTPISGEVATPVTTPRPAETISDSELKGEIKADPETASDLRPEPNKKSLFGRIVDRIW